MIGNRFVPSIGKMWSKDFVISSEVRCQVMSHRDQSLEQTPNVMPSMFLGHITCMLTQRLLCCVLLFEIGNGWKTIGRGQSMTCKIMQV